MQKTCARTLKSVSVEQGIFVSRVVSWRVVKDPSGHAIRII